MNNEDQSNTFKIEVTRLIGPKGDSIRKIMITYHENSFISNSAYKTKVLNEIFDSIHATQDDLIEDYSSINNKLEI